MVGRREFFELADEVKTLTVKAEVLCGRVAELTVKNQDLEREVAQLRGRVAQCENTGSSANARCERVEGRVGVLEHRQFPGSPLALGDKDVVLPTKQKTCPTCRGSGVVLNTSHSRQRGSQDRCPSCDGTGHVTVVPT